MSTAKARYKGDGGEAKTKEFSSKLKLILRGYFPSGQVDALDIWGHPADHFVSQVLAEAQWALAELHWQKLDITKPEIRAEQHDLLRLLNSAHDKLRSLSPDFERLLDVNADPLGCADQIQKLVSHVEHVGQRIESLSLRMKPAEKQHRVAVELAIRVLPVLEQHEISTAATCDLTFDYISPAVCILKAISDDIGICFEEVTWRDIIMEAKKDAADFQ